MNENVKNSCGNRKMFVFMLFRIYLSNEPVEFDDVAMHKIINLLFGIYRNKAN